MFDMSDEVHGDLPDCLVHLCHLVVRTLLGLPKVVQTYRSDIHTWSFSGSKTNTPSI